MDSFTQMVHEDSMNNLGGSFHRYLRRSALSHFGIEPLKRNLLSEFEDVISNGLHEWTKQPEFDVKRRTVPEEHEEILNKRQDASSGIVWEDYKSMTFTHYVINETLRLVNVLPGMLKKVIADSHVNGYTITKGWILLVNSLSQHLNSDTYENPLTFNPSRWKDDKNEGRGGGSFTTFGIPRWFLC
ncbi:Detected protein of confused Function [Hibiscus syriacus]|uniref:Detected protein of confused Function n=1 Tax=Hibiscus syriacus TaxID=106335 RepID=A0A6A2YWI1_HIBSY|nr:Detected protein of confused Function [Hibiscus syriacus]